MINLRDEGNGTFRLYVTSKKVSDMGLIHVTMLDKDVSVDFYEDGRIRDKGMKVKVWINGGIKIGWNVTNIISDGGIHLL